MRKAPCINADQSQMQEAPQNPHGAGYDCIIARSTQEIKGYQGNAGIGRQTPPQAAERKERGFYMESESGASRASRPKQGPKLPLLSSSTSQEAMLQELRQLYDQADDKEAFMRFLRFAAAGLEAGDSVAAIMKAYGTL